MSEWFDRPSDAPRTRRPFHELIQELRERLGQPHFEVTPALPSDANPSRINAGEDR